MFGNLGMGKEMDRATEPVQVFILFDKCMICLQENEENIHFCKCYQSLTIKNSLGKRSGIVIQNCGYCYIVLFTVNLAQYW